MNPIWVYISRDSVGDTRLCAVYLSFISFHPCISVRVAYLPIIPTRKFKSLVTEWLNYGHIIKRQNQAFWFFCSLTYHTLILELWSQSSWWWVWACVEKPPDSLTNPTLYSGYTDRLKQVRFFCCFLISPFLCHLYICLSSVCLSLIFFIP